MGGKVPMAESATAKVQDATSLPNFSRHGIAHTKEEVNMGGGGERVNESY